MFEKMSKRAVIYARVSKDEQNPENQINALKSYSLKQGYNLVKEPYIDIITGTKDSRPALNNLMFDSRENLFDVVIIWKLDRLGRSLKHLINIAEEWYKKGIDFVCISQNIDTTTASGKLTFHILGAVAEFERELISERTKQGFYKDKDGIVRGRKTGGAVGKRGKDNEDKPRRKSGYHRRWEKERSKKMGVP